MIIREMTAADVSLAAEIENKCFAHPWSEQSIESEMNLENSVFLMAFEEDKAIGYVGLSAVLDEGYMGNLAVVDEYRRKGIGRALMKELLRICKDKDFSFVTLEVRESNLPAINLYLSLGFERVGVRKNYYKEPTENALLLTKYFKEINL